MTPRTTTSIPLPDDFKAVLLSKVDERSLPRWGVEAMVAEAARQHIVSRRKAATLLGLHDFEAREAFFLRHELFNEYTLVMLEEDFATIDRSNP